jgi:hypothetical protein
MIIIMWGGLHMVTSTPYWACHSSSIGKPSTAVVPRTSRGSSDHGTWIPDSRTPASEPDQWAVAMPSTAEVAIRQSPTKIAACGAVNRVSSRP